MPCSVLTTHQGPEDRLEQARKVQQLLAALKQPQNGTAPPPALGAQPGPPPQSNLGMPPPPQNPNPYYPPPSLQQPAAPYQPPPGPSANPYAQMSSQTSTPQPAQMHAGMSSIPSNILALLQQSQGQQSHGTAPQQMPPHYGMPPAPPQSMMSPPPMSSMPPGAPQPGTQSYQQLMAILVSPSDLFRYTSPDYLASRPPRKGPSLYY